MATLGSTLLNIDDLGLWAIERGLRSVPLDEQVSGFCDRLVEAGLPARRFNVSIGTLHPHYGARSFIWVDGKLTVEAFSRQRTDEDRAVYTRGPIYFMRGTGIVKLRRRLDTGMQQQFPLLDEFAAAGMTEYAARLEAFDESRRDDPTRDMVTEGPMPGVFLSCTTDAPGGFDDRHIEQLDHVLPAFALAIKSRATLDVARTVLETYLGEDAGRRVLTGQIDRNVFHRTHAVIWLCDLRGFSTVANRVEHDDMVEILDAYLELMARPVLDHHGQILKFLGDGFLAIFEISETDPEQACKDAMAAVDALIERYPAFNEARRAEGKQAMDFGIALHVGDVLYGNIGTRERLDFTVVGSAVNEASRIERLCRPLGQTVLVSSAFTSKAHAYSDRMVPLGEHALHGICAALRLYTISPDRMNARR